MAEQKVHRGETWRRKKDGTLVTVSNVSPWYTEFDIYWNAIEGKGRGAIWQFNFLNNYERVEESQDMREASDA